MKIRTALLLITHWLFLLLFVLVYKDLIRVQLVCNKPLSYFVLIKNHLDIVEICTM